MQNHLKQISRWFAEGGGQPVDPPAPMPPKTDIEEKEENGIKKVWITVGEEKFEISDGAVAIAAITSCTNTSNPFVMIGAGLVARKARRTWA